jgi:hypothetical protein
MLMSLTQDAKTWDIDSTKLEACHSEGNVRYFSVDDIFVVVNYENGIPIHMRVESGEFRQ